MNSSLALKSTPVDARDRRYQARKRRVHEQLLNQLNLERLTRTARQDAEPEVRQLIVGLLNLETQTTPLSLQEREAIVNDAFDQLSPGES